MFVVLWTIKWGARFTCYFTAQAGVPLGLPQAFLYLSFLAFMAEQTELVKAKRSLHDVSLSVAKPLTN